MANLTIRPMERRDGDENEVSEIEADFWAVSGDDGVWVADFPHRELAEEYVRLKTQSASSPQDTHMQITQDNGDRQAAVDREFRRAFTNPDGSLTAMGEVVVKADPFGFLDRLVPPAEPERSDGRIQDESEPLAEDAMAPTAEEYLFPMLCHRCGEAHDALHACAQAQRSAGRVEAVSEQPRICSCFSAPLDGTAHTCPSCSEVSKRSDAPVAESGVQFRAEGGGWKCEVHDPRCETEAECNTLARAALGW
jgi:hypothetical protein